MDDNAVKYAKELMKNLSDIAPNLEGFAKSIDAQAKKHIEDLRVKDPVKAEAVAREYSKTMAEAKLDEKFSELIKAFKQC